MHDLGDESALQQWLATFPAPEADEQMLQRQLISLNTAHLLIYVQALLACQRWHEAEPIIQKQHVLVERQELSGSLLQWLILQAQLAQAQGDSEQALTALAHAIRYGRTQRLHTPLCGYRSVLVTSLLPPAPATAQPEHYASIHTWSQLP